MTQESQDRAIVKDKTFLQPYKLKDSSQILCLSPVYPLEESDFIILTKTRSGWSFLMYGILMCAGALFLSVAGKYINSLISKQATDIKSWELIAIGVALVIVLILKVISIFCPDDRKKLLKKIGVHFKTVKKHVGVLIKDE